MTRVAANAEEAYLILGKKLESKGYRIVDEFQCKGFNTNSFMRFFGGMNKGRPDAKDLKNAKVSAQRLKQHLNKKWRRNQVEQN